jgi:hypothetical protein
MIRKIVLLSTLAGASVVSAAAAGAEKTSYEMASYLGWPGGREIAAGEYDAAIARTAPGAWRRDATAALVGATNRCVAYTIKRAFAGAEAACDEALERAKREDRVAPRSAAGRRDDGATAKALLNRGVLRAVMGNSIGAAADFRAAALDGAADAANRNLASLEASPAHRTALLGTAD